MRSALLLTLAAAAAVRADQFEHYTNPVLAAAVEKKQLKEVERLTSDEAADAGGALNDTSAAFLVVYTNDRRYCRLLVHSARQKFGDKEVPILLVEKYQTFKEGTDRQIKASGQNVQLYAGSRINLDLGQVVPDSLVGDLQVVAADKDPLGFVVKPLDKAKLYVVKKAVEGVVPKKADKLAVGEAFEVRYFAGEYKLSDDGRRSGKLKLEVSEAGDVTGSYYSDKDGQKYEVKGKAGVPVRHAIAFSVKLPAAEQTFTGYLFTGNGKTIAGSSKLSDRESAFTAERIEE